MKPPVKKIMIKLVSQSRGLLQFQLKQLQERRKMIKAFQMVAKISNKKSKKNLKIVTNIIKKLLRKRWKVKNKIIVLSNLKSLKMLKNSEFNETTSTVMINHNTFHNTIKFREQKMTKRSHFAT